MNGTLTLISGCMFSGKTSYIIRKAREYSEKGKQVEIYYPDIDTRYRKDFIISHDQDGLAAIPIASPHEIPIHQDAIICIDELQFFDQSVVERLWELRDAGAIIFVAGLRSDYRGEPFPNMPEVTAMADEVIILLATCHVCGDPAGYNQRMKDGREVIGVADQIVIGGSETYEARCEEHFIKE